MTPIPNRARDAPEMAGANGYPRPFFRFLMAPGSANTLERNKSAQRKLKGGISENKGATSISAPISLISPLPIDLGNKAVAMYMISTHPHATNNTSLLLA